MRSHPVLTSLLNTAFYLIDVSGVSFLVLALIASQVGLQESGGPISPFLIMGMGAFVGGTFWARAVSHGENPWPK